jgi:hypothetical protein
MWLIFPALIGFGAALTMGLLCIGAAFAGMAGPVNYSIMYFISIPAALGSAFLASRRGIARSLIGALVFSVPTTWLCYDRIHELSAQHTSGFDYEARQWVHIGLVTVLVAFISTALFVPVWKMILRRKQERKS